MNLSFKGKVEEPHSEVFRPLCYRALAPTGVNQSAGAQRALARDARGLRVCAPTCAAMSARGSLHIAMVTIPEGRCSPVPETPEPNLSGRKK